MNRLLQEGAIGIEFVGALINVGWLCRAMLALVRERSLERARELAAQGALAGLDFKLAASLLKTIGLSSWNQIGLFVTIFSLRFVLKKAFRLHLRPEGTEGRCEVF